MINDLLQPSKVKEKLRMKLKAKCGYRAVSQRGVSLGALKSVLQKAARRRLMDVGLEAMSEIASIVLVALDDAKKGKSNVSNVIRRCYVILAEDLIDSMGLALGWRLRAALEPLCRLRKRMDKEKFEPLNEEQKQVVVHALLEAASILCDAPCQSRSASSVRAVCASASVKDEFHRVRFGGRSIVKWLRKELFDEAVVGASGAYLRVGVARGESVFGVIRSMCPPEARNLLVAPYLGMWREHASSHREAWLWPVASMLAVRAMAQEKHDLAWSVRPPLSSEQAWSMFQRYVSQESYRVPGFAVDQHVSGGPRKGSEAAVEQFLSVSLVFARELHVMPPSWKKFYEARKRAGVAKKSKKSEGAKRHREEKLPSSGNGKKQKKASCSSRVFRCPVADARHAVLAQLPCGLKPSVWLIVDREGKKKVIKGVSGGVESAKVQLFCDAVKPLFGLRAMGVMYDKKLRSLVCDDIGLGANFYSVKAHHMRSDVMILDAYASPQVAAVPAKKIIDDLVSKKKKVPIKLLREIVMCMAWRHIIGVSDSHLGNLLVSPPDSQGSRQVISVDEACFAPRSLRTHREIACMFGCRDFKASLRPMFNAAVDKSWLRECVKGWSDVIASKVFRTLAVKAGCVGAQERMEELSKLLK